MHCLSLVSLLKFLRKLKKATTLIYTWYSLYTIYCIISQWQSPLHQLCEQGVSLYRRSLLYCYTDVPVAI